VWHFKDFRSALSDFIGVKANTSTGNTRLEKQRNNTDVFPMLTSSGFKEYLDNNLSTIIIHCTKLKMLLSFSSRSRI